LYADNHVLHVVDHKRAPKLRFSGELSRALQAVWINFDADYPLYAFKANKTIVGSELVSVSVPLLLIMYHNAELIYLTCC
jgi:hypothetical protein